MPRPKKSETIEREQFEAGVYKGYDMRWLRRETDHPDHYLVAEYDALLSEKDEPSDES